MKNEDGETQFLSVSKCLAEITSLPRPTIYPFPCIHYNPSYLLQVRALAAFAAVRVDLITPRNLTSSVMASSEERSHAAAFTRKVVGTIIVAAIVLVALDSADIQKVHSNALTSMKGIISIKEKSNKTTTSSLVVTTTKTSPLDDDDSFLTGTTDSIPTTPTAAPTPAATRYTYQLRGQPITEEERQEMVNQWGSWTLRTPRPATTTEKEDFYARYPNRDVPRADFPPHAWQRNKEYLDQFFPEALALVERAQEAILSEYGHGRTSNADNSDNNNDDFEERSAMFRLEIMDTWENQSLNGKRESAFQGGFTTQSSWEGFVRRILHAIMTEDTFVFAMGGHSAAAGHG